MEALKSIDGTDKPAAPSGSGGQTTGSAKNISGVAMDRRVAKKKKPWKYVGAAAVLGVVAWAATALMQTASEGRTLRLGADRLTVSAVTRGVYENFIPISGRVTPRRTVFLDAIEGGRVERVLVEDGAEVAAGQLLVELSNSSLQLSVTRNEALVTEQLNNMRTLELELEQNRLRHKRNLADIDYNITRLTRLVERRRELVKTNAVSQQMLDDVEDELAYQKSLKALTLESQATDAKLQEAQLQYLRESGDTLRQNLALARKNLDALNVRAPVAGKLSGFDAEIGQSIANGGRLGQVDTPNEFKLTSDIDEFYLNRVDIGQRATISRNGESFDLAIKKIYPQVKNGQFQVDLTFKDAAPAGVRRGQTLQTKLTLGDSLPSLLIPNGAFYQTTGGNWVFVVTADGTEAVRRPVKLGMRNARYIQVLEGLEEGERVITSPYSSFEDMDRLKLD